MTISEFEQGIHGSTSQIMGDQGPLCVTGPPGGVAGEVKSSFEVRADTLERQPGRSLLPGRTWSPARALRNVPFVRPGKNWGSRRRPFAPLPGWTDVYMPRGP